MKKETIIKFYAKYRLYIFPIVVALSSLFLIIFAIYPQTVKLMDNQKAVGDLIDKSKFLNTKVQALESYNEENLSQKVGAVLTAFPADKDFDYVLGLLQELIAQSGFITTSISLGNTGGKLGNADTYGVKLEIKGSRVLLQSLLNNLENSPRLIRINNIDISSIQTSQILGVSLGLEVLYSQLPQKLGTLDSPLPELSQKDEQLLSTLTRGGLVSSPLVAQPSVRGKVNPFE